MTVSNFNDFRLLDGVEGIVTLAKSDPQKTLNEDVAFQQTQVASSQVTNARSLSTR